jgi:hypothetical protein
VYLKSKECELADSLILAFQSSDREKLEQAKRSVEMNYLDVEMQKMGRSLVLFDECYLDSDPPVLVSSGVGSGDVPTKKLLFHYNNDDDHNDDHHDGFNGELNLDDINIPLGKQLPYTAIYLFDHTVIAYSLMRLWHSYTNIHIYMHSFIHT